MTQGRTFVPACGSALPVLYMLLVKLIKIHRKASPLPYSWGLRNTYHLGQNSATRPPGLGREAGGDSVPVCPSHGAGAMGEQCAFVGLGRSSTGHSILWQFSKLFT